MNISKLKGVFATAVAAIGLAAVAANVEITSVTQTPGSGKATVNYAVSGLSTKTDLAIKASANGESKSTTITGVANGVGSVEIDYKTTFGAVPNVAFSAVLTDPDTEGVQLWADGPYWATCNVGASKPEDSGYHFWWGDTVGYRYLNSKWEAVTSSTTIEFASDKAPANNTCNKTLDQLTAAGYRDASGNLVSSCDAATAYLGAPWRMPTVTDFNNVMSYCTAVWTNNWNGTGVNGRLITGKGAYASKSIFLPAAGWSDGSSPKDLGSYGLYWSSTPNSANANTAWYMFFDPYHCDVRSNNRYYGQSVRAVRSCAK